MRREDVNNNTRQCGASDRHRAKDRSFHHEFAYSFAKEDNEASLSTFSASILRAPAQDAL